jgi:hypothetical protein
MLGKFKAEIISAGIRSYVKDGVTRPQFCVKLRIIPGPDSAGKEQASFIREWTGTYNEGDNRKYTDEALMQMGYLYQAENFADFEDLESGWTKNDFDAVIDERAGQAGTPNADKMFEYVKSIWGPSSTDIKNALAKDAVVNIMAGLQIPQGHAAMMREKIKEKNNGQAPKAGAGPAKAEVTKAAEAKKFADEDVPW